MARGQAINWEKVIRDFVDLLGVNKPQATRREQIAAALGLKIFQVDPLAAQLRAMGALEVVATPGGFHEIGGRKYPIRASTWTVKMPADKIIAEGKLRNAKWGQQPAKNKPAGATAPPMPTPKPPAPPPPPAPEPKAAQEDSPFAVLRALKRDEAAALIESARQYQEKRAFINEEIARFAEHGITLDPAVIGLPVDERLEAISPLADYVTRLQNENTRLQAYVNEKVRTTTEFDELQRRLQRQEEQLTSIARAREQEHQDALRLANQWSGKEATLKGKIAGLEQENRDLRNALGRANGAATADATQGMRRGV